MHTATFIVASTKLLTPCFTGLRHTSQGRATQLLSNVQRIIITWLKLKNPCMELSILEDI